VTRFRHQCCGGRKRRRREKKRKKVWLSSGIYWDETHDEICETKQKKKRKKKGMNIIPLSVIFQTFRYALLSSAKGDEADEKRKEKRKGKRMCEQRPFSIRKF